MADEGIWDDFWNQDEMGEQQTYGGTDYYQRHAAEPEQTPLEVESPVVPTKEDVIAEKPGMLRRAYNALNSVAHTVSGAVTGAGAASAAEPRPIGGGSYEQYKSKYTIPSQYMPRTEEDVSNPDSNYNVLRGTVESAPAGTTYSGAVEGGARAWEKSRQGRPSAR